MSGFSDIGFVAFPILLLALLGALLVVVGLVLAVKRSPVARALGPAAVLLGVACAALGGGVAIDARGTIDKEVIQRGLEPEERVEARRRVYLSVQGAPRFGVSFAAPLMASGALVWLIASRRKKGEQDSPPFASKARRFGPPAVVAAAALGALGLAHVASLGEAPGRDLPVDSPVWTLAKRCDQVARAQDPESLKIACEQLEEALSRDNISPAQMGRVTELRARTRRCIEERRNEAAQRPSLTRAEDALKKLYTSWLLRGDKEAEELVTNDIAEVGVLINDQQEDAQPDPFGTLTVRGSLSTGEIRRVVRDNIGYFRICLFSKGSGAQQGTIRVTFELDEAGSVTHVTHESTNPDPELGDCFARRTRELRFPKRRGRSGEATYVFTLKRGW